MARTIAQMFIDQGREEGLKEAREEARKNGRKEVPVPVPVIVRREVLLQVLRKRFKIVVRKVQDRLKTVTDLHILDAWIEAVFDAKRLADMDILLDQEISKPAAVQRKRGRK